MLIASLIPDASPSALYRSILPMQALAERGHRVHVEERVEIGAPGPLLEADVVQVFRLVHPAAAQLARRLTAAGVRVVYDNDYDVLSAPPDHPVGAAAARADGSRYAAAERRMLQLADVVTVPTAELARRFEAAGARRTHVVENFLPPGFERPRTAPGRGLTIGWAATAEHEWDFHRLGIPDVLARVLERHLHVRLLGIGADVGLSSPRYEHVPWSPYETLHAQLARCDVAIAPLADVPFNATRSNVKLKEYAAVAVPWLASPVGDYAWMGAEEGGRLVADGDWNAQIEALVRDADLRAALAARGRRWAAGESIVDNVAELETLFEQAAGAARR